MGSAGRFTISVAALPASLTTANAGIMTASRYLFAISRDQLLPRLFNRVETRSKTPWIAVLATGVLVLVAMFVHLEILVWAIRDSYLFPDGSQGYCVQAWRRMRPGWSEVTAVAGLTGPSSRSAWGAGRRLAGRRPSRVCGGLRKWHPGRNWTMGCCRAAEVRQNSVSGRTVLP